MKKLFLIPVCAALAAVGAGSLMSAKSYTEQQAIDYVAEQNIASAAGDLIGGDDKAAVLNGDPQSGQRFLKLATKYTAGDKVVEISWKYDDPTGCVYRRAAWDETHDMIEFNFPNKPEPGQQASPIRFEFAVDKFKCGSKVVDGSEYDQTYKLDLAPNEHWYDTQRLDYFVKLNADKTAYDIVDFSDPDNIYFKKYRGDEDTENQKYYYSYTYGKVMYMSPDCNWGIIADGKSFMQLYFGGTDATRLLDFPALKTGKYVRVRASLSHGYGNFQMSFVTEARECTAEEKALIEEPVEFEEMTGEQFKALKNEEGYGVYVQDHLMNKGVKITGKYVPNSLKDSSGKATKEFKPTQRATFKMNVGGEEVNISYDYHVQFNELGKKTGELIKKIIANPNKEFELEGTLRYNLRNEDKTFKHALENMGDWTITPYSNDMTSGGAGLTMGAIIGISVGGVVAVAGIGVGVFFLLKKKKHAKAE